MPKLPPIALALIGGAFVYLVLQTMGNRRASTPATTQAQANRLAFLAMLRSSEGTDRYANPYTTYYGGAQFTDLSDHPVNTGEMAPVQTPWGTTTAAGAYQFEVGTWNDLGGIGTYGDFGPNAQDSAALDLMESRHSALDDVDNGAFYTAIGKLGSTWASLPSSTAGQPTVAAAGLATVYTSNGGQITDAPA